MTYWYISGLRAVNRKWCGSKLDFINNRTGNVYIDYYACMAEIVDISNNLNNGEEVKRTTKKKEVLETV